MNNCSGSVGHMMKYTQANYQVESIVREGDVIYAGLTDSDVVASFKSLRCWTHRQAGIDCFDPRNTRWKIFWPASASATYVKHGERAGVKIQ